MPTDSIISKTGFAHAGTIGEVNGLIFSLLYTFSMVIVPFGIRKPIHNLGFMTFVGASTSHFRGINWFFKRSILYIESVNPPKKVTSNFGRSWILGQPWLEDTLPNFETIPWMI
ncbi:hypothetical protein GUJ93_ZPchr0003g18510 [Zizania palustris]|uniref:Uncharacterized protein n=1 Tax=Zizania palustris TaxID=103762 RepID=A0A8J5VL72_ZIZPA|nr:hypothetical protein GUJ93_ZPchr0003g18510 [Zizania palustris]